VLQGHHNSTLQFNRLCNPASSCLVLLIPYQLPHGNLPLSAHTYSISTPETKHGIVSIFLQSFICRLASLKKDRPSHCPPLKGVSRPTEHIFFQFVGLSSVVLLCSVILLLCKVHECCMGFLLKFYVNT